MMIRASAGRRPKFSGQALPLEKYFAGNHSGLLIVEVNVGIGIREGGPDKEVHRIAAKQTPVPGIFVVIA